MGIMNLRLKLRKTQSNLPSEKLTEDLHSLEILGESIEKIPSLAHLENCSHLLLVCPNLADFPALPPNLKILKIKGGHFNLPKILPALKVLTLQGLSSKKDQFIDFSIPHTIETLDLSNNALENLPIGFKHLQKLVRLTLDHNQLKTLPECLFQLKSLNHLSLDANPLTEEMKQRLFEAFGIWF